MLYVYVFCLHEYQHQGLGAILYHAISISNQNDAHYWRQQLSETTLFFFLLLQCQFGEYFSFISSEFIFDTPDTNFLFLFLSHNNIWKPKKYPSDFVVSTHDYECPVSSKQQPSHWLWCPVGKDNIFSDKRKIPCEPSQSPRNHRPPAMFRDKEEHTERLEEAFMDWKMDCACCL